MVCRARVHRFAWIVVAVAAAIAAFAPIVLGPATPFVVRALGGEAEHRCACGMKAGKCACPECARLEEARRHAERRSPVPAIKTSCDGADAIVFGQVPPAVLPAAVVGAPLRSAAAAHAFTSERTPPDVVVPPETPPPRPIRA